MITHTTCSHVQFQRSFKVNGYRKSLPPGRYKVEMEEEWIEGLSFKALRRMQLRLYLPVDPKHPGTSETLVMENPQDLYVALANDKKAANEAAHKEVRALFKGIRATDFDLRARETAENEGMV